MRTRYRTTTEGSSKWANGHNAGCVFYAPPHECICKEFDKEELMRAPRPKNLPEWFVVIMIILAASVAGLLLGFVLEGLLP